MLGSIHRPLCVCNAVQHIQGNLVAHGSKPLLALRSAVYGGSFASELDGHSLLIDILKGCSCHSPKSGRIRLCRAPLIRQSSNQTQEQLLTPDKLQTGFSTASV